MAKDCKAEKSESFNTGKKVGFFLAKKMEGENKKSKKSKLRPKPKSKPKSKPSSKPKPKPSPKPKSKKYTREELKKYPPQAKGSIKSLSTIAKSFNIRITKSSTNQTRKRKQTLIDEIMAKQG